MAKNTSLVTRRAWNILRLALLGARKGGIFRRRLALRLTELGKGLRKLRNSDDQFGALMYGDREFSFGETPVIHVKMHRPSSLRFKMPQIPCIKPLVDFDDYEFKFDDEYSKARYNFETPYLKDDEKEVIGDCDEGIDLKAEQFIAKFYEQMKLQRRISRFQYDDQFNSYSN